MAQELPRQGRQEERLDEDVGERQELLVPVDEQSKDVAKQEWSKSRDVAEQSETEMR